MAGLIAPFTVRTYTPSACAGRAYSKYRKAHMVNLKMAVIRSLFNVTLGTGGGMLNVVRPYCFFRVAGSTYNNRERPLGIRRWQSSLLYISRY